MILMTLKEGTGKPRIMSHQFIVAFQRVVLVIALQLNSSTASLLIKSSMRMKEIESIIIVVLAQKSRGIVETCGRKQTHEHCGERVGYKAIPAKRGQLRCEERPCVDG